MCIKIQFCLYSLDGHVLYSSPPPDLKGKSDVDLKSVYFWKKQENGILTDGSLGDVDTRTIGAYGKF